MLAWKQAPLQRPKSAPSRRGSLLIYQLLNGRACDLDPDDSHFDQDAASVGGAFQHYVARDSVGRESSLSESTLREDRLSVSRLEDSQFLNEDTLRDLVSNRGKCLSMRTRVTRTRVHARGGSY